MKKLLSSLIAALLIVSCSTNEKFSTSDPLVLCGYCDSELSRTAFGTPTATKIPFAWSKGDYIWLGNYKSNPIAEDCSSANFRWDETPSVIGGYHIFYNMTGTNKTANVLAEQSADGNLGNDGDFGYALADEFGTFVLSHKTSYFWFDTTSADITEKLVSISVTAPEGVNLAGKCAFDYANNAWSGVVTEGSNTIVLTVRVVDLPFVAMLPLTVAMASLPVSKVTVKVSLDLSTLMVRSSSSLITSFEE